MYRSIKHAGEARSFVAKCHNHKCRRGTSRNEEAVHKNFKFIRVVCLEALFHGCKVKYLKSGNAIGGDSFKLYELHSSAFV